MKQKIIEALKQKYAATNPSKESGLFNLGLDDAAFERVASLGETFITEEAQIENFVKGAEPLLKGIQSEGDKLRTAQKRIESLEKLDPKPATDPEPPATAPQPTPPQPDMAELIANAVAAAMKPLNEKITAFESKQSTETAIAEAKAKFGANDYVKKYKNEADDAWERVMELHEYHKDWTAEQISEKAMGYFNKSVSRMDVDTTKPFDGGGNPSKTDFSAQVELLKMQGVDISEPKND